MQTPARNKNSASILTRLFFITATVSAIIGLKLYDPLLSNPDYLWEGAGKSTMIKGGALAELITCCANIGTAIMLYPHLRRFNESVGIGYVCFRFLEVVFIIIGIVSMLALLTVCQGVKSGTIDNSHAVALGETLKATYHWTFLLGPNFILGTNTFLYSYAFYKTNLVPKRLAILGLTGAVLILAAGFLLMFGFVFQFSTLHLLMAMPIAVYEMVLAGWLISKGFKGRG